MNTGTLRALVVGGHTRNIGKTALAADIIRAFPQANWTAVKITQYGHGVCSINGEQCGCAPSEHSFALEEEQVRNIQTDTSRFLQAGASRALWLRTRQGGLADALPSLLKTISGSKCVILESNSILRFVKPDLYLVVMEPAEEDFKDSAMEFLDCADGFVLRSPLPVAASSKPPRWDSRSLRELVQAKPVFLQRPGDPLPEALADFIHVNYLSRFGIT